MSFDWSKYLQLAEELNSGQPTPEKMRSAISRAYYSIFNKTKMNMSITKKSGDVHKIVINSLKACTNESEIFSLGNYLDSLREKRNDADYDGNTSITQNEVASIINMTKSYMENLNSLGLDGIEICQ